MDYLLWGISYANAKLMLADAINEEFSKNKETSKGDDEMFDLSDPAAFAKLQKMYER